MSANKVPGNTKNSVSRRIMNVFLSLVLVLGLMPNLALANTTEETGSSLGSDVATSVSSDSSSKLVDEQQESTSLGAEELSGESASQDAAGDATDQDANAAADATQEAALQAAAADTALSAQSITYKQADGYEAYTGWQGWPWPGGDDSSSGGTARKGWPSLSLANPLSAGTIDYQNGAVVRGTEVTVVTDMNATDTSIEEPTASNPWYYKNIILPSYDVSQSTISFVFMGVAPGGMSSSMANGIAIATSSDPSTWDGDNSTIVWQASTTDVNVATAGSNWWKRVTVTASTENLQAGKTYYLVLRAGMPMGNVTSYANMVFEFSTASEGSSWQGDMTNVGYLGCQGTGTNKIGFFNPAWSDLKVDTTVTSCYYNKATKKIALATQTTEGEDATTTTSATFRVHADGSGSNWTNIAGWQSLTGTAAPNVNVYDTDPTATGSYDVSSLTPVCTASAGTITFALANPDRDWPTRDGVDISVQGLEYDKTYYLVFNEKFAPNNMGALGTPVVLEFTTEEDTSGYSDYAAQGSTITAKMTAISPDEDGSILASIKNDTKKNTDTTYFNRIVNEVAWEDGVSFTYTLSGGGWKWATVDSAAVGKVHVYSDAALTKEVFAASAETSEKVSDGTFKVTVPASSLSGSKDYYLVLDSSIETNNSRTLGKTIVFKFTTQAASSAAGVDKSLLLESITNATQVLNSATVGTEDGMYPQSAVDDLTAAIATAQAAYDGDELTSVGMVKQAAGALDKAVSTFKDARIFSITSIVISGVPESIVAGEGGTASATVTSNPQDDWYTGVTWSASSNVTINEKTGVWTATTWGNASITATSASDPTVSQTVEFTVTEPEANYTLSYTYDSTNKTATLSGFTCTNTVAISVVVPETVEYEGETYTVTAIASGLGIYKSAVFGDQPTLVRKLVLPSTMETIGAYAFRYMTNLKEVDLGETKTICSAAFSGSGIENITIPDSVTTLEQSVFSGASSLKSVSGMKGLTTIPSYTFNNTSLETIEIPENVTTIDYYAMTNNSKLKSITGMAGVTSISTGAFSSNVALEQVELSNKITSIPQTCFSGDTALKSVTVPASVTSIEGYAFYRCTGLQEVLFDTHDAAAPTAESSAFAGCNNVVVYGYESATAVAALVKANNATEVNTNTGANFTYENRSYEFTYSLDETAGTATVTGVACVDSSISECNISVPAQTLVNGKKYAVTAIGEGAFANSASVNNIVSVTLPTTIETVGEKAFANMSALTKLTSLSVSNTAPSFAADSFEGTSGVKVVCYDSATTMVALANDNAAAQAGSNGGTLFTRESSTKHLSDLTVVANDQSATGSALDTVVITDDEYTLVEGTDYTIEYQNNTAVGTASYTAKGIGRYDGSVSGTFEICLYVLNYSVDDSSLTATLTSWSYNGADQVDVVVPSTIERDGKTYTVTAIQGESAQNSAFNDPQNKVNTISVPDTLTTIGNYAFTGCSKMVSFTIPESVTSIGDYAFYQCFGLKSIDIPESVKTMGSYSMALCTGLEEVTGMEGLSALPSWGFMKDESLKSVYIPENITSAYATFYQCTGLEKVSGMKGLTEISTYMFGGTQSLKNFVVPESVTSIGVQAFYCASGLESITIPASVTIIGNYAFYYCTGLKEMTFLSASATSPEFGQYSVFGNTSNVVVYGYDSATTVKEMVAQNSGSTASYTYGTNFTFKPYMKAQVNGPSKTVFAGEEFSVEVVMSANKITGAQATFDYDTSLFKLTDISAGEGLSLTKDGSFAKNVDLGSFSFACNSAPSTDGLVVAKATFKALATTDASSIGVKDIVIAEEGNVTDITIDSATAASVSVCEAPTVDEFAAASQFVKVTYKGAVAENTIVLLNDEPMLYNGSSFVAVLSAADAAALTSENFSYEAGTPVAYTANGDVNVNGRVNVVDAQVVYDVAGGLYAGSKLLTSKGLLNGDVSGDDGILDAVDAYAIMYSVVHNGAFPES